MPATFSQSQSAPPQYQGLLFSFAEMEREIENMRKVAKPFLEPTSFERVIREWRQQLTTFKSTPPEKGNSWSISEDDPIQTIVSEGKYEPTGGKGKKVFGRVSSTWQIKIPKATGKKRGGAQQSFVLLGLASTKVTIWAHYENGQDLKEIARWTIEVGDATSPGCHFHTQIDLDEADNKFPKFLSVPRLPALLHTPMDALEFLLAELFQDEWHRHISQENDFLRNWAGCQRHRLTKLLEWQQQKIREASGSPWTTFKRQKPPLDLFVNGKR